MYFRFLIFAHRISSKLERDCPLFARFPETKMRCKRRNASDPAREILAYAPWILFPTAIAIFFLAIPLIAILWRTPWTDFFTLISSAESIDALWLSLRTCILSVLITLIVGLPFALVLARSRQSWWIQALRILVLLPMVLPPVVAGLALLLTWGRMGLIGQYLNLFGITIGFSTVAVIFAQVFVSLPFFIISLEGSLHAQGQSYDLVARGLGASRTRTFFTVTLPIMKPAILSSLALSFSRALGEFGATITFAGSLQGITRTMPLQIYLHREADTDQALALAVILIVLAIVMLGAANLASGKVQKNQSFANRSPQDLPVLRKRLFRKQTAENKSILCNTDEALSIVARERVFDSKEMHEFSCGPSIDIHAEVAQRGVQIDLQIRGGQIAAIMGANGAGKSTLLELIAGTLKASSGDISFDPHNPDPAVILLQQNPLLFPHLSVLQNVEFGLRAQKVPRLQARERALAELQLVEMADFADSPADQLSGGQAQRVAIARAMAISPNVVLLDEPFVGLDEASANLVRAQFKTRLEAEAVTVLLVTHDLLDAEFLADELILLRHGRVVERRLLYSEDALK